MSGVIARIDLSAIAHNYSLVRQYAPKSQVMAVVKANAYGHGILQISRALAGAGALGVARLQEAVELREGEIRQDIVVLAGFDSQEELAQMTAQGLVPVIHSLVQIAMLEAAESVIPFWLKADTGMHRLGLSGSEIQDVLGSPLAGMMKGVMSHLACADDRSNDMTHDQIRRLHGLGAVNTPLSLANSAGILGWQDSHLDWVRPGIMLYGISPFKEPVPYTPLQPAMELTAPLISITRVPPGGTVGYGATWRAEVDSAIGVLGIGYGDGYPREAPPGTPVLINGRRVPIVGRISMDMTCIDLTGAEAPRVGDRGVLWGKDLPVEEIAQYHGTIPYTLVTGLTGRVERVYVEA